MLLTAQPLSLLVLAKIAAHWLLTGLPLVLIAPLVGMQYHLTDTAIGVMMLALLRGTPVLSVIGAIGAALTEITSGLEEGQDVVLADIDQPLPGSATDTSSTDTGPSFGGGFPAGGFTPPGG